MAFGTRISTSSHLYLLPASSSSQPQSAESMSVAAAPPPRAPRRADGHDGDGDDGDGANRLASLMRRAEEAWQKALANPSHGAASDRSGRAFEQGDDVISLAGPSRQAGGGRDRKEAKEKRSGKSRSSSLHGEGVRVGEEMTDRGTTRGSDEMDRQADRLGSAGALAEMRPRSKRQLVREARERKARTAGPGWFDMPALPTDDARDASVGGSAVAASRYATARGPTAEEVKREIQAIRLRNALDPKRFFRGGSRGERGMPKYAQLGRIVSSNIEPAATMGRAERGRTVVEELIKDSEATSYAKRKFAEHQAKRASGGRGHMRAKQGANKKRRRS